MKPYFSKDETGDILIEWVDNDKRFGLILSKNFQDSGWYFMKTDGKYLWEHGDLPIYFWNMVSFETFKTWAGKDFHIIEEKDTVYTLDEFLENVEDGNFIDDDGYGYYGNEEGYFPQQPAIPSEIKDNGINKTYTCVVWFNR